MSPGLVLNYAFIVENHTFSNTITLLHKFKLADSVLYTVKMKYLVNKSFFHKFVSDLKSIRVYFSDPTLDPELK